MAGFNNDVVFAQAGMRIGDITITTGEEASIQFSDPGDDVALLINNTSNSGGSDARNSIRVEGTNAGDPYQRFQVGASDSFSIGIGNSLALPDVLIFNYNDDGDCSPSNNTNQIMRFSGVDPITGRSSVTIRSSLAVASEGVMNGVAVDINPQNVETDAGSDARINIQVSNGVLGGGGGNAYLTWTGPADSYSLGVDKTDGNNWKLNDNGIFSGNTIIQSTPSGEVTFPLTPCFLARRDTPDNNVTGDGTTYTVVYDQEVFDQGGDFDGISTFTAPVTGRYLFIFGCSIGGLTSSHTEERIRLNTSNRSFEITINPFALSSGGNVGQVTSILADMDAADTCQTRVAVSNGTLVVDIRSGSSNFTYFSGKLEA